MHPALITIYRPSNDNGINVKIDAGVQLCLQLVAIKYLKQICLSKGERRGEQQCIVGVSVKNTFEI